MSLRHPNIVTFIGTCVDKNDFYLVTEYLEKRSLKNVLENKNIELNTLDKLKICFDIAVAIYYLHSRKPQVFHRDLKSSNCLVDAYNRVKLCDFGISKIYEELKTRGKNAYETNCISTSFWMAPEFIIDNLFTDKADIYAYGILMWEVMMRDPVPYKNINEVTFLLGDKDILKKRPIIPDDFNTEIRALMELCWHSDYKLRPDISVLVEKLDLLIKQYK
jgi:serine/threonine protein kinase